MFLLAFCGAALAAWPLSGTDTPDPIQDPFGPRLLHGAYDFHRGIDLNADIGDAVHVVADGEVVRLETEAQSAGTGRASFGSWVLVEHAPLADGTPVHTAYFHLDTIDVTVGAELLEGDALGTAGDTGTGIETSHLHLNAYEGLRKTYVKKEKSVSPWGLMGLTTSVSASLEVEGDTATLTVADPNLDAVRIELEGSLGSHLIDYETEEGVCGDAEECDGVTISPDDYRTATTEAVWTFEAPELGELTAVRVYDSAGSLVASW